MAVIGIICEYNPLHNGHIHQWKAIREKYGEDSTIVCLMSGNYVQRGSPAIYDKAIRAEAAIRSGADLVLELPITASLSSAEKFADIGVSILSQICDVISFGCESMNSDELFSAAKALLSERFNSELKKQLQTGISYPSARERALTTISGKQISTKPNDTLSIEYCKAILKHKTNTEIFPLKREGGYHDTTMDKEHPSATAVRVQIVKGGDWHYAVPQQAISIFENAELHRLEYGEKAILYRLKTMNEEEYAKLPYGSEGLWRRFMHACRKENTLQEIIENVKTKRYTRTRIDRMIMCAYLGITNDDFEISIPYTRILGFNDKGQVLLNRIKESISLLNTGARGSERYGEIEEKSDSLYFLFSNKYKNITKRKVYVMQNKETNTGKEAWEET